MKYGTVIVCRCRAAGQLVQMRRQRRFVCRREERRRQHQVRDLHGERPKSGRNTVDDLDIDAVVLTKNVPQRAGPAHVWLDEEDLPSRSGSVAGQDGVHNACSEGEQF